MDYTEMPKPNQPEVSSHRPLPVCSIVTISSSVLASLCHVLLTSEASSVTGCYMPVCVTQPSLSAAAMWYGPVGPSAVRQGASLSSPHSPLLRVLCSKDLPRHKHNTHHCGLFYAENLSISHTCFRKTECRHKSKCIHLLLFTHAQQLLQNGFSQCIHLVPITLES